MNVQQIAHLIASSPRNTDAARRGETHAVHDPTDDLVCSHNAEVDLDSSVCVPLLNQSGVVGILHLQLRSVTQPYHSRRAMSVARAIADRVAGALYNVEMEARFEAEISRVERRQSGAHPPVGVEPMREAV